MKIKKILTIVPLLAFMMLFSSCGDYIGKEKEHPFFVKAGACKASGNYKEAAEYYEEFLNVCPRSPITHYELAALYGDNLDDPFKAVYHYQRYLELAKNSPDAENVSKFIEISKRKAFDLLSKQFESAETAKARLVANPGCYPTATTLGLYPVLKEGMVVDNTIIVDAKSGYTGAGRRPAPNKLLAEASNSFCAYSLGGTHRHTPEIEQNIAYITGKDLMKPETWQFINFQPHLTPQIRGIEVTIYATLNKDISNDELYELYQKYYKDEYFVHVYPASKPVQTKWTAGTNLCCITPTYDARTKRLLVSSVIDNIGKGAAGQAIQNMNIIFGLDETTGLKIAPMYP